MITTIDTIDIATQLLKRLKGKILTLLDIDDTILIPQNPVMRTINKDKRSLFLSKLQKIGGDMLVDKIFSAPDILVEDDMKQFVDTASTKGNIFALTLRRTGLASPTETILVQNSTANRIDSLDIKLSYHDKKIEFDEPDDQNLIIDKKLNPFHKPEKPMLYKSIIFTCNINKGFIFEQFIKHFDKPDIIFSIDNDIKNLLEEEKMSKDLGFEFIGFEYIAYQYLEDNVITEDIDKIVTSFVESLHNQI